MNFQKYRKAKGGGGMAEGGGVQAGKQGEKAAVQKAEGRTRVSKIFKIVLPPAN